jgi:hypothetical protein
MTSNITKAPRWADEKRTAEHMGGVSTSTLAHARISGKLPIPFVKVGNRVLYDLNDVDTYLLSRKVANTAQADALAKPTNSNLKMGG